MKKQKQISIVYMSVDDITPYEKNARFNEKAVDAVAKSIEEYGFKNPCCAIGDTHIDGKPYAEIVEEAREYIDNIGGFEKFAEWGLY